MKPIRLVDSHISSFSGNSLPNFSVRASILAYFGACWVQSMIKIIIMTILGSLFL